MSTSRLPGVVSTVKRDARAGPGGEHASRGELTPRGVFSYLRSLLFLDVMRGYLQSKCERLREYSGIEIGSLSSWYIFHGIKAI